VGAASDTEAKVEQEMHRAEKIHKKSRGQNIEEIQRDAETGDSFDT
jgi:hypothetical protein